MTLAQRPFLRADRRSGLRQDDADRSAEGARLRDDRGSRPRRDPQEMQSGGDGLPWIDRERFAELMFEWELRSYREAERQDGPVIFDRGLPDTIGYLRLEGLEVPAWMEEEAWRLRYNSRVFIAPPWKEILRQGRGTQAELGRRRADLRDYGRDLYGAWLRARWNCPALPSQQRADFVVAAIARIARQT